MDAHPARQNARGVLLLAHSATLRNPQERPAQIVATALGECRSCRQGVAEQRGAVSRSGAGSCSRRIASARTVASAQLCSPLATPLPYTLVPGSRTTCS